jgi:predicted nucleic acid-binding protein
LKTLIDSTIFYDFWYTKRELGVKRKNKKYFLIAANLVSDTHLAALAIEHGLTLCSMDGNFGRFPGLRWQNPLRMS